MSAVKDALDRLRAEINTIEARTQNKAFGGGLNLAPSDGLGQLSSYQQQGSNRRRYSLFRGWVHSAINALAMRAAKQKSFVGRSAEKEEREAPGGAKYAYHSRLKTYYGNKSAQKEREILEGHPFAKALETPNAMQTQTAFIYNHVANLCLTGWSFVVAGKKEGKRKGKKDGGYEFYSIPTTWVTPLHEKGPFSEFRVQNPNNPAASAETLDRTQVAFCCLPDPSDPMAALALTQAQAAGIKIDDNIQTSQSVFFDNGVFPSVLITIGNNPHPDVPAGQYRPRLSANQRRQVVGAIKKMAAGVANYGNPAIIDGLIEKIERLQSTANEMGWEKSERSVRTRILSAFGVHPFILGEEAAGSYAAAYQVERVFCGRVNFFLSSLSSMMTGLVRNMTGDESLEAWWDEAEAVDKQQESQTWDKARSRGDATRNEFRAYMGLPPDEDGEQAEIDPKTLTGVVSVASAVTAGTLTPEQGQAVLEGLGLSSKLAKKIAGGGPEEPMPGELDAEGNPLDPMAMGGDSAAEGGDMESEDTGMEDDEDTALETAATALGKAAEVLLKSPSDAADDILQSIEDNSDTAMEDAVAILEKLTE